MNGVLLRFYVHERRLHRHVAMFEWLLEQPDPDLADWLIGGTRPAYAAGAALVDDIVRRRR